MTATEFRAACDDAWNKTMQQTLEISETDAVFSNGLSEKTANAYQAAAELSDAEMLQLMDKEEL
jgi:hypothetical protein